MKKPMRYLNLVLSDLHIGNRTLRRRTGGDEFTRVQQRRRLAYVVQQAAAYKRHHRDTTALVLWILGDLGHGEIHRGGDRMSDQVSDQIALLGAAVRVLSEAFCGRIEAQCVTGNHGRFVASSPDGRAVDDKSDSWETIVYRTLGCKVTIPETPYAEMRQFGYRFLATHGDTMFRLPNPGRSVNIGAIEGKVNRWTASRWRPDVVLLGHHHTPTVQVLPAGNTLLVNGSLCPADEYCLSVDIPSTPSAQVMFETTRAYAVGDLRIVRIGGTQDRDRSLDKVLK